MSLQEIIQQFPKTRVPAGTHIFRQGDACLQYFILTQGTARMFTRSVNGKEILLYRVSPDSVCVLTATCIFGGSHFPAEAVAETDMEVRVISKPQFEELMTHSPEFREHLLGGFGERISDLIHTIQKLALESIEERLLKLMLMQPQNIINLTHQQIAEEIGTAREVVSRHLKKLEALGYISLGRGSIELVNRSALLTLFNSST